MDGKLIKQLRTNFPKSTRDTIVVGSGSSPGVISYLDCVLSSPALLKSFGIGAICFQDPCFDWKLTEVSTLIQTTTRMARTGVLHGVCLTGSFFSDIASVSSDVFRSLSMMIASFKAVNLSNVNISQRHYGYILGAVVSSTLTTHVNIEGAIISTDAGMRSAIKTSSGALGVSNTYAFLLEIANAISNEVSSEEWNSGWVFQEAQRMVLYVLSNSFLTTVPVEVGLRLFIRACAFVLDMQSGTDVEILRAAVRRCEMVSADPELCVIVGVVQTEAGFLPGPTQSMFGFSSVPERYLSFHQFVIQPDVFSMIDSRSSSEIRAWIDVATLPFVFRNLCRAKIVTGSNVDELFTWALEL